MAGHGSVFGVVGKCHELLADCASFDVAGHPELRTDVHLLVDRLKFTAVDVDLDRFRRLLQVRGELFDYSTLGLGLEWLDVDRLHAHAKGRVAFGE